MLQIDVTFRLFDQSPSSTPPEARFVADGIVLPNQIGPVVEQNLTWVLLPTGEFRVFARSAAYQNCNGMFPSLVQQFWTRSHFGAYRAKDRRQTPGSGGTRATHAVKKRIILSEEVNICEREVAKHKHQVHRVPCTEVSR